MLSPLLQISALSLLTTLGTAAPVSKRRVSGPAITANFPDPAIVKDGDTWHAFGTNDRGVRIQHATSQDFSSWSVTGNDVLGRVAPWVDEDGDFWAPDVVRLDNGDWLLYYTAVTLTAGNGNFHCVGTAISDNPDGPFNSNSDEPFACQTDQGGAIDPAGFRDDDGTRYVMYKIDGNALGNGGLCNNGVEPIVATPIMIQQVEADGTTHVGGPTEILTNGQYDGPLVEAPSMVKADGTYVLFFSSNCYSTTLYDVSYATSSSPTGGFVKSDRPLLVTGTQGLIGPGGLDISGRNVAFHAYETDDDVGGRRSMYVGTVSIEGGVVSI